MQHRPGEAEPSRREGISVEKYRGAARLLEGAADAYRLPITPAVSHMWETVLVAIKYADDRLDTVPSQQLPIEVANILGLVGGATAYVDADPLFQGAMLGLQQEVNAASPDKRTRFLTNLEELLVVTCALKKNNEQFLCNLPIRWSDKV